LAGSAAAGLGIVALVVVLVPESSPIPAGPTTNEGPAQLAVPATRLTAADRRGINAALDRFVPAAVLRKSAATAWALAGPELKSSSSLAAWRAGESPVPYFPAKETTFHHWTAIDVTHEAVVFNLLMHPRAGSNLGNYVFSGQVVRRGSHWLVNRLYTIAVLNPSTARVVGPNDFGAGPASPAGPRGNKSKHGAWPVALAVAILALAPLVLLAFALTAFLRGRRFRRETAAGGRNELPPLPLARYRPSRADDQG
jgi:hypothetical protein